MIESPQSQYDLGGGFFNIFEFSPLLGEMIQFDLFIFFKWVGLTTNYYSRDDDASDLFWYKIPDFKCDFEETSGRFISFRHPVFQPEKESANERQVLLHHHGEQSCTEPRHDSPSAPRFEVAEKEMDVTIGLYGCFRK